MHYMEFGGAERALLGLLNAIDTERVEVDLLLNQHTGAFLPLIPKKIHLLPEIPAYSAIERPMKAILKEGHWGVLLGRLLGKLRAKCYLWSHGKTHDGSYTQYAFDGVIGFLPSLGYLGHYDAAISFIDPPHIVQDKVDADVKMEWVHTDFETLDLNKPLTRRRWERNDYIIAISEAIGKQFLKAYPGLDSKVRVIENIISPQVVRQEAEAFYPAEYKQDGRLIICSVGRISTVKNFGCIPAVARRLKEQGLNFDWYIIGPGDASAIMKSASELAVTDQVHCLGARSNPYPYLKHCDLYVQPSLREGKSITVREAQILGRPVVITHFATAESHIQQGVDGVICEMDNGSIADAVLALANDSSKRQAITDYLLAHDYGNEQEVNKIYALLRVD